MSLAAVPAFFLARRVVGRRLCAARGAARGRAPVARLHRHGDDGERLLPALPRRRARPRRRPRAADAALGRAPPRAPRPRVRDARAGGRARHRPSCSRRSCSRSSSRRGLRQAISRYRWLYGIVARRSRASCSSSQVGLGTLAAICSAPTRPSGRRSYDLGEALRYLWWHVAELSLYVLVVPLAATIVLVAPRALARRAPPGIPRGDRRRDGLRRSRWSRRSPPRFSDRIEERNTFYVAPLLCIALLAWVERGAPRPRVLAAVAAADLGAARRRDPVRPLPHDVRDHRHAHAPAVLVAAGPDRRGLDHARRSWRSRPALAAAFLLRPEALRARAPAPRARSLGARVQADLVGHARLRAVLPRRALPGDPNRATATGSTRRSAPASTAAFLWTGRTDRLTVNQNEFFNRSVGPVYYVTDPTPGGLPETRVRIDPKTGRVTLPDGSPVRDEFLLADSSFEPDGARARAGQGLGCHALARRDSRSSRPSRIDGLYPNDTWSGPEVTYLRRRCRPGRLAGRPLERPEPLLRAADGRRALERGGRRPRATPADGARTAERPGRAGAGDDGLSRRLHGVPRRPCPPR